MVVGGAGAVGAMLVELLRGDGSAVTTVDLRSVPASGQASPAVTGDITAPDSGLRNLLSRATTVILAVPESVALGADTSALREDALLVETLSVKSRFAAHVAEAPGGFAVLGVNPMFAPSLGMAGRPVAAVSHRPGPGTEAFLARVAAWGGRVVEVGADDHDRLAAATQALTHAAVLSFGLALRELNVSMADIEAIAPPPHATMLGLLARVTGGEPEVYWDVQAGNPHAAHARAALQRATHRLHEAVESGTENGFGQVLNDAGLGSGEGADRYRALCARIFGIVS